MDKKDDIRELKAEALRLRLEGYTYREIGKKLNRSHQWAHKVVRKALEEEKKYWDKETVENLRYQELIKLDKLWNKAWKIMEEAKASSKVLRAIDTLIRIHVARCKLLGIDEAPPKVDENITYEIIIPHLVSLEDKGEVVCDEITVPPKKA